MVGRRSTPTAMLAFLLALSAGAASGAEPPRRIVSLNLCTDQLLMDLVPADRIAALSFLATDPTLSAVADRAKEIRSVRAEAEQVLALEPDLVVTAEGSTPATIGLLRRLGYPVLAVPLASDFDAVRSSVRKMARAVGEEERGEAIVAEFDRRLARVREAATGEKPTAMAYQVNSIASGPGTLLDAALEAAGFYNLARDEALGSAGRVPLETLVTRPPDLLVFANGPDEFRSVVADNLRHPALAAAMRGRREVRLEMPLWLCGTPRVVEAVERLAALREAIRKGKGS